MKMSYKARTPAGASPVPGTEVVGSISTSGLSTDKMSTQSNVPAWDQAARLDPYTGLQRNMPALRSKHPSPTNRKAAEHLQRLLKLGYSNFSEIDVEYWEPRIDGKTQ